MELIEIFDYNFMITALYAAILASITCGIVGTLVVCNRLSFLAGGAAHAAYGGIGVALFFKLPILACTLVFSLFASLLMGVMNILQDKAGSSQDSSMDASIGVLWSAGMAFGIILIQFTPGYAGEFMGFLIGSILTVPNSDLVAMLVFNVILCAGVFYFRQGLWAVSLDKDFARSRGLPVNFLYLIIIGLTAVAVVMLIRIVGLVLVLALLTIPPLIAKKICSRFYPTMFFSTLFSLFFCVVGLIFSWYNDVTAGAAIIAVATICYFFVLGLQIILKR